MGGSVLREVFGAESSVTTVTGLLYPDQLGTEFTCQAFAAFEGEKKNPEEGLLHLLAASKLLLPLTTDSLFSLMVKTAFG